LTGELGRLEATASLAFRGSLRGIRLAGLAAFAALPTLLVAAIASGHPAARVLANAAEQLFVVLTLPIVVMVIVLVLSVAQFRSEIDAETLVYLTDRSVARATIVGGKYLGSLAAALLLIVPATLLPLAVATLAGGTPYAVEVPFVLTAAVVLAAVAYGGFFLFLGLATRSALLVGLLFGFLWEELLPLLPGDVPRFTVIFYLRDLLARELPNGPLSGLPTALSVPAAVAVLVAVGAVFVVLGSWSLRYLETSPERESA
jgi:ABC-2 type transport system permease protein